MRSSLVIVAALASATFAVDISGCSTTTTETPPPASYAFSNSPEPIRSAKRGDEKSIRQFLSWATKFRDGASGEAYAMDFGDLIRAVGDVKLAHVLQTMTLDPDLKSAIWEVLSGGDAYLLNERKLRKDFPMTCKVLRK